MDAKKKMGRPTDNPKIYRVQAKLDEDSAETLRLYCEKHSVNQSEAMRIAIMGLSDEPQKEKE